MRTNLYFLKFSHENPIQMHAQIYGGYEMSPNANLEFYANLRIIDI